MRKSKDIKIDEEVYTVWELSIGAVLPILPLLNSEDTTEQATAQLEMMKLCIHRKGKPMGEEIEDVGLKTYLALATDVMEINGLGDDKSGND
jgi:hypothetical protein